MTPESLAKNGSESAHQMALFAWAALNTNRLPSLKWLHHIPNGGSRGDTVASRAKEGGKLKAQGVKKGVLDIFLPVQNATYSGLYIEMKKAGGKMTPEQIQFAEFVQDNNYCVVLCESWIEAAKILDNYLLRD